MNPEDDAVIESKLLARISLAQMNEQEMLAVAHADWLLAKKWVMSDSVKPYSFLWCCRRLGVDYVDAVRRTVKG